MRILGVGHVCMIPACSNTKKLEQAQKRQKKREVDQCQSQSSSIAEVSSQDKAPAAIKFRVDSRQKQMFGVANQNQQSIGCQSIECATPMARTERHRKASSFRSSLSCRSTITIHCSH